jgi:hypothetical protein
MVLIVSSRRVLAFCATVLVCGLLVLVLHSSATLITSLQVPEGMTLDEAMRNGKVESPEGWTTNSVPHEERRDLKLGFHLRTQILFEGVRTEICDVLGQTLYRAPNPPRIEHLLPRLSECSEISGETYLLAKELVWQIYNPGPPKTDSTFLGFIWGGTNQPRSAMDWTRLIEDGILRNGVFGMRLNLSSGKVLEYSCTNRCAIVRDTKGLVKIVPIDCLKAYIDAGLVRISNSR